MIGTHSHNKLAVIRWYAHKQRGVISLECKVESPTKLDNLRWTVTPLFQYFHGRCDLYILVYFNAHRMWEVLIVHPEYSILNQVIATIIQINV